MARRNPRPASPMRALAGDSHVLQLAGPCTRGRARPANPVGVPRDARRVERHEKRADAAAARAGIGRREHDRDVGDLGVGHPDLGAVDDIVAAVLAGGRRLIGGVRSRRWLRTARTRRSRSPDASGASQARALLVGAVLENRLDDQRVVHAQDHGQRRAGLRHGFHRQRVGHVVAAGAAELRRNRSRPSARARRPRRRARADTRRPRRYGRPPAAPARARTPRTRRRTLPVRRLREKSIGTHDPTQRRTPPAAASPSRAALRAARGFRRRPT